MECQILFTGKNKKNIINLSFAENAHRVVKVKVNSYLPFSQGRNFYDGQKWFSLKVEKSNKH